MVCTGKAVPFFQPTLALLLHRVPLKMIHLMNNTFSFEQHRPCLGSLLLSYVLPFDQVSELWFTVPLTHGSYNDVTLV